MMSRRKPGRRCAVALLWIGAVGGCDAAAAAPVDAEPVILPAADVVVVGRVGSVRSRWNADRTRISTMIEIAAGPAEPVDRVTIEQVGGVVEGRFMTVDGLPAPDLRAGERVVFFFTTDGELRRLRGFVREREGSLNGDLAAAACRPERDAVGRTLRCPWPGLRVVSRSAAGKALVLGLTGGETPAFDRYVARARRTRSRGEETR